MKRPTGLVVVDQHGNLDVFGPMTDLEGRARQFCNRWGWQKDRPAMLADLRKLLDYAQRCESEDDDAEDR